MADPNGGDMEDGFEDEPEKVLINTNPNYLMLAYNTGTTFLATYGWYILFTTVLLVVIWSNIEKKVKKMLEKSQESQLSPEELARRAEAIERSRQRMQEKASSIVQQEAERRREFEEKKRSERLDNYDAMKSGRSLPSTQKKLQQNDSASTSNKPRLRPGARPLRDNDYNPLTGTTSRYTPSPRRTGGG